MVSRKKRTQKTWLTVFSYYSSALLGIIGTVFLLCALISFYPSDPSFFYRSASESSCHNWCGLLGSYCAAFLLFWLGGFGAFFFCFFVVFISYLLMCQKSIHEEWDRIAVSFSMVVIAAVYAHSYDVDCILYHQAGGVLGSFVASQLLWCFDSLLLNLFLFTLVFASIALMSRLSSITVARFFIHSFSRVFDELFQIKVRNAFCFMVTISVLPFKWLFKQLRSMLDGSEIITGKGSIIEFEYESASSDGEINSEHFWRNLQVNHRENEESPSTIPAILNKSESHEAHSSSQRAYELPKRAAYQPPSTSWFKTDHEDHKLVTEDQKALAVILEEKLERFGIRGNVISIKIGPVITLFEYQPEIDSKISKIIALEDDLALALQALSIRIIAPIPGRSVVGFEVSNKQRRIVLLGHVLQSHDFKNFGGHLPLVLGQDSIGSTVIVDLALMPHLLVAGSTGSGKSVSLNGMLISLLCKHSPETMRLILIDPKRLEFASYADIPHLLVPIVTDPRRAALVLKWVVKTMEERYALMQECNVRNIFDYHKQRERDATKAAMPFIVVMIDELSDLMMTAPKETEDLIARITQMARAAGIHMVVATQRPSVDVITGLIKVNFPSRISFRVTSKIDSRTILDCNGADKLLGKGDMLYLDSSSSLKRAHAAFVSDKEIEQLVGHIRSQQKVEYIDPAADFVTSGSDDSEVDDHLYYDVLNFVESIDEVSISLLQRKFRIGYNRSARIIDKLESQGIIMQEPGGKTRKVIR